MKLQRKFDIDSLFSWNKRVNPFTPESDQCQNSPAASQEIWHHTVWRTWLFIAYSDEKWLYYKFSLHHSYNRFLKGWKNTPFELRSKRVNKPSIFTVDHFAVVWDVARTLYEKWCKWEFHRASAPSAGGLGTALPRGKIPYNIRLKINGEQSAIISSLSPQRQKISIKKQ